MKDLLHDIANIIFLRDTTSSPERLKKLNSERLTVRLELTVIYFEVVPDEILENI